MPETEFRMSREFAEACKRVVLQVLAEQQVVPVERAQPILDEFQEVLILGKTDADHDKGSTGTISIYGKIGETIGSETDTGDNIEGVYNRFADLTTGQWVIVLPSFGGNGYELIAAEC